ncbi:MAG: aromatic ring hydroxylase [candidate division Zixibacteria bacterium RBG_16_40_9]|nr:MAG: aromatic ring hydroxylase [candidate division Zixibacteria bacterium RBG_16_40_9]
MVTREQIYEALKDCYDPEIPVNLVDLGLIYDVQVNEQGKVEVKMTLTAQGCCMGQYMAQDAQSKILALPGVTEANVELVWDPPWDPSKMSVEAKKQLGFE